ncbi:MAG: hypothetical protein J6Q02_07260, partial [Lachnospiraceae bacterium]|nr:hypothetical protein [Lachnospiraceae bacterium]
MELAIKVKGCGCKGKLHVWIDGTESAEDAAKTAPQEGVNAQEGHGCKTEDGLEIVWYSSESKKLPGKEIGVVEIGLGDGIYRGRVEKVTGRHALYFKADLDLPKGAWTSSFFDGRAICELEEFVFLK